jgi:hypothetical protein
VSVAEVGVEQSQVVLTSHPLQRVGAYAIVALGARAGFLVADPRDIGAAAFDGVMSRMTADVVRAALVRDSKGPNGFWLKSSFSFFPNAPMNHPSNGKKTDEQITRAVQAWRRMPDPASWPPAACVLCGRGAVGFFGKLDVALAESDSYRNTTPRGHAGMALCWPCLACFYALPYGSQLTGGSSIALHSWDERFLRRTVDLQVDHNLRLAETGDSSARQVDVREVVALRALRRYGDRVIAGVDLVVFNNNNRGQSLEIHTLEQPLAEWLRHTMRDPTLRPGFRALTIAHTTKNTRGLVGLARNAFRDPTRIAAVGARRLVSLVTLTYPDRAAITNLAALLYSFAIEVMLMNEKDLAEIRATARNIAAVLEPEETGGKLRQFRAQLSELRRLTVWLTSRGVQWAIRPPNQMTGPLVTERAFTLLFDPGLDNPARFHRDLLLVGVLEELSRLGWQPTRSGDTDSDAADEAGDVAEELDVEDSKIIDDDSEAGQ